MYGSAPGRMHVSEQARGHRRPCACAERTQISLTALTPVQLLKMMGKAETKPTSRTDERLPSPNQSRKQRRVGEAGDRGADRYAVEERYPRRGASGAINTPMVTPTMLARANPDEQANDWFRWRDEAGCPMIVKFTKEAVNFFECRKEPAWKNTAPGNDLPDCADYNERKNISPDQPQALRRHAI